MRQAASVVASTLILLAAILATGHQPSGARAYVGRLIHFRMARLE